LRRVGKGFAFIYVDAAFWGVAVLEKLASKASRSSRSWKKQSGRSFGRPLCVLGWRQASFVCKIFETETRLNGPVSCGNESVINIEDIGD
jgi:hypothetical protein